MTDFNPSLARVGTTELRVLRVGTGAPLLFLHGAGGLAESAPALAALSEHFTCIAPEHPGFGGSRPPEWLDRVSDLANFYLDFIKQEGLSGIHLVGHDLGGWIAAEMAVRNTSALASLTLISAQGIHVRDVPTVDVFLRTDEDLVRDTYYDAACADAVLSRDRTDEELNIAITDKEVTARLTWQPRGHDPQLMKWLQRIDVPTLVVWGKNDRILPVSYGTSWQDRIPGASLKTLPNCGHAPHLEQTAATVAAITRFTASTGSTA